MATRLFRSSSWLAVAALALAAFLVPAHAAPIGDNPKPETAAEKIKKALDTVINAELDQTTFGAALEHIRDKTKINVIVDKQIWLNQGIQVDDCQVNVKLKDVKVRTALKQVLAQLPQIQDFDPLTGQARPGGVTFVIDDDILYITFEHRAMRRQMQQRVTVDAEKAAIDSVLKQISKDTGVNIVLDPRQTEKIKEPISLQLNQVPVETAVRLVAEMAGMKSVKLDNVLFVTSKESAIELRKEDAPHNPQMGGPGGRFNFPQIAPGCGLVPFALPGIPQKPVPAPANDLPAQDDKKPDQD